MWLPVQTCHALAASSIHIATVEPSPRTRRAQERPSASRVGSTKASSRSEPARCAPGDNPCPRHGSGTRGKQAIVHGDEAVRAQLQRAVIERPRPRRDPRVEAHAVRQCGRARVERGGGDGKALVGERVSDAHPQRERIARAGGHVEHERRGVVRCLGDRPVVPRRQSVQRGVASGFADRQLQVAPLEGVLAVCKAIWPRRQHHAVERGSDLIFAERHHHVVAVHGVLA